MTQCTAKSKRSGNQCRRHATRGKTKCRIHGGATPGGKDSPHFKHGLYSKYAKSELAEKIKEFREREEKLTDLLDVLALQHSLLSDALEKNDLESVRAISETISRNIERHHKITEGSKLNMTGSVSLETLFSDSFDWWEGKELAGKRKEK